MGVENDAKSSLPEKDVKSEASGDATMATANGTNETTPAESPSKRPGFVPKKERACFEFRETGNCRFRDECHFSHDVDIILTSLNRRQKRFLERREQHMRMMENRARRQMALQSNGTGAPESKSDVADDPNAQNGTSGKKNKADRGESDSDQAPRKKKAKVEIVLETCDGCGKPDLPPSSFANHINGKPHAKKIQQILPTAQFACALCVLVFNTEQRQTDHVSSELHADRVKNPPPPKPEPKAVEPKKVPSSSGLAQHESPGAIRCDLCNVDYSGAKSRETHLEGKKHKKAMNMSLNPEAVAPKELPVVARCDVCDINFTQQVQHTAHITGKRHQKAVQKSFQPQQSPSGKKPQFSGGPTHEFRSIRGNRRGSQFRKRGGRGGGRGGRGGGARGGIGMYGGGGAAGGQGGGGWRQNAYNQTTADQSNSYYSQQPGAGGYGGFGGGPYEPQVQQPAQQSADFQQQNYTDAQQPQPGSQQPSAAQTTQPSAAGYQQQQQWNQYGGGYY